MKKSALLSLLLMITMIMKAQQNSTNFKYLDINQVKAGIWSKGLSFWDSTQQKPSYEVPAGGGKSTTAGSGLWITAVDNNGVLYTSAQTYRQNGSDFYTGPASSTPSVTAFYNQAWEVTAAEIHDFKTGLGPITNNIRNWPGNGDITQNQDPNLAPYLDVDANGYYEPEAGDYPCIKGDKAIFFVINDWLMPHSSGAQPIGVEIRCMAYAFNAKPGHPEFDHTTFIQYQVIHRSSITLQQAYISLWNDVNIGYGGDDYIGCHVQGHYSFAYNGDTNDETNAGYGNYPPVQGYQLLNGPFADAGDGIDNDGDGCTDCTFSVTPTGTISVPETTLPEQCLMNRFTYFNAAPGTPAAMSAPVTAADYRNYATGHWKDGSPFTCGGNAHGGTTATDFVFPDSAYLNNPGAIWSESSVANAPGDRHTIMSCGPFTMKPGAVNYLNCAYVTVFNSPGTPYPSTNLAELKTDMRSIKEFHRVNYNLFGPYPYFGFQCSGNPYAGYTGINDVSASLSCSLFPNPAQDLLSLKISNEAGGHIAYEITDVIGKTMLKGEAAYTAQLSIPVSELRSGVYFIKLTVNGRSAVKKFVKE